MSGGPDLPIPMVRPFADLAVSATLQHMDRHALAADVAGHTRLTFARAGGPGGQNVNMRSTKVVAAVTLRALSVLTEVQKQRVGSALAARINEAGELVVHVTQERSQLANRRIALGRLVHLIQGALREDRPRVASRPTAGSRERRLERKRRRGDLKRSRRRSPVD